MSKSKLKSKSINPSPSVQLDSGNVISLNSAFHKEQQSTIITQNAIAGVGSVFGTSTTFVDFAITPHTTIDKCTFACIELNLEVAGKSTGGILAPSWWLIDHIDYLIDQRTVDTVWGSNMFQELSYLDSNKLSLLADSLGYDKNDLFFPNDSSIIDAGTVVVKRLIPLIDSPLTSDINWKAIKDTFTVRCYLKNQTDAIACSQVANQLTSIKLSSTQLIMAGVVYPSEVTNSIIADHYTNKTYIAPVLGRRYGYFNLAKSLNTSSSPINVELSQFKGTFSNLSFYCNLQSKNLDNAFQSLLSAPIPTVATTSVPSHLVVNKSAPFPWVNLTYSPETFLVDNVVLLDSQGSTCEFTAQNSGLFIKSGFDIKDESPWGSVYSIYNLNFSDKMGGNDGDFTNNFSSGANRYVDGLYSLQLTFPSNIWSHLFASNVILNVVALQECSVVVKNGTLDYIRH